jgi:creatinine amidohydrolase/Fe(II)-dependent formamide hydrolase-like protein
MGDPTRASAEKGKILYDKLIEYLVDYLNAFKKLDPALK